MNTEQAAERCRHLGLLIEAHQAAIEAAATERRALVIVLFEQEGMTLREIGKLLGVSGPRISQIMGHTTPRPPAQKTLGQLRELRKARAGP